MSDDFLDRIQDDEDELYGSYPKEAPSWLKKVFFWLVVIGGIAIGVCLFLFFMTLFLYVFLPLFAVFLIWVGFKKWQWNREWRKMTKEFYRGE
ncbi:MAG: hypothetical protein COV74_10835 [Candidatus Omnitrophica bacterium CG11_big_fil_rev_8_21_14_0_20_45_26]|uniref:Uncharacterized protein n=1 Tax=Candidatus Abzuiibacterium crystallinum TaxID=1974748 RepID=A0A2H0LN35_9BACT|nr:MAG: hypothetical protein COV74_10835 [Candidatus Omnitrophica bacterium CG11_big_fil_rev_8_21_14_0_20_45_26]PIW63839.1 MAG: hypothetical protein COW12_07975 [Candidatus Omnitrophica bacterium CG12_big_fil_rev_8_21_14_0_65_45_16]